MNTTEIGNLFEDKVYAYFKSLIDNDEIPYARKKYSKIFKHKKYKSIGEERMIEADISIETYNPEQTDERWSHLIIIECKNYKNKVNIGVFDAFEKKMEKISSSGIKGIFVTTKGFSKNNIEQARNSHVALAIFPEEDIQWITYRNIKKQSEFLMPILYGNKKAGLKPLFYLNGLFMSGYNLLREYEAISKNIQFDIPFISKEEIKENAQFIYNKCKFYKSNDIAGEVYAKMFSHYHIDFKDLPEGILGLIDIGNKSIVISNSIIHDEHRIHFTLAHELGHIHFHESFLMYQINKHEDYGLLNYNEYPDEIIERMEIQANKFASYLLLPTPIFDNEVFKLFKEERINKGYVYLDEQPCNKSLVYPILNKLSNHFNVSKKVVKYRMIDDGYLKISKTVPLRIDRI